MKEKEFIQIIKNHKEIIKKLEKLSGKVGIGKLMLIIFLGINLYFLFNDTSFQFIILGFINFAFLVAMWVYHNKIHNKINFSNNIININQRHLARINGTWTDFLDIGEEFINDNHNYSGDLDIIGNKSFFQFLNTTNTWHGRQSFANSLLNPNFNEREILQRQEAIKELSEKIEFSNLAEDSFEKIGVYESITKLIDILENQDIFIKNKAIKFLLTSMPFLLLLGVPIFFTEATMLYIVVATVIAAQGIIWVALMLKTNEYLKNMYRLPYKLTKYSNTIKLIVSTEFKSEKLNELQSQLKSKEISAATAIKELGAISNRVSFKYNPVIWFILNIWFLWDIETSFKLQEWGDKYSGHVKSWFNALGEFESLICFSNFPNICSNTVLPQISNVIEGTQIGHPLIANNIRVSNNFNLNNNIFIISGSNMSGKTTFMRTIGINLVLAKAGSFVCGNNFKFLVIEIATSMRIADDLSQGVSTFYAELNKIKNIISIAEKNPNMIFLIDEIFRGTNSTDRISGAKIVLSKLEKLGTIGVITTHDLELCQIADDFKNIINHSFCEEYKNGKILFDYKLKQGKSLTTNAKHLMEIIGIK